MLNKNFYMYQDELRELMYGLVLRGCSGFWTVDNCYANFTESKSRTIKRIYFTI